MNNGTLFITHDDSLLVNQGKYNDLSFINKLIMLYFFYKSCPFECRIIFYISLKCLIKIFLESEEENSHNVKRTDHAANSLARSSIFRQQLPYKSRKKCMCLNE